MGVPVRILVQHAHQGADQPQLTPLATPRGASTQQSVCPLPVSEQQPGGQRCYSPQRDGKQGKQPRPGLDIPDACGGKTPPPFGVPASGCAAAPLALFRCRLASREGALRSQIPHPPLALLVASPPHGHPPGVRGTATIEQAAKTAVPAIAGKAQRAPGAPDAVESDQRAALDPTAARHAPLLAYIQQRHLGKASGSRPPHSALARSLAHPPERPTNDRTLIALHATGENRSGLGTPG
jgi:hypothetical protein